MKALLPILFLCLTIAAFGQTYPDSSFSRIIKTGKYPIDDNISYKGGKKRLWKIIRKNAKYPEQDVKDSIRGTVYLYFTIDTNGHSKDIIVIKSVRDDLDKEAIRCVSLLNEWIPGKTNGKKVVLHNILPIKFDFHTAIPVKQGNSPEIKFKL